MATITSWHAHKHDTPIFIGDGPRYIGVELEIDRDWDDTDEWNCAPGELTDNLEEMFGDSIYFEHDGSLNNGFEIITQPHSEAEMNNFKWGELTGFCRDYGYRSHQPGTCGLHLHYSREWLGSNKYRQDLALSKIVAFYDIFWDFMVLLSRRRPGSSAIADYADANCSSRLKKTIKVAAGEAAKDRYGSRYRAVNCTNATTIEFRLGRGTLNEKTLRAWINIHTAIVRNSRKIAWDDVTDLHRWLKGIDDNAVAYIKKRLKSEADISDLLTNVMYDANI